MKVLLGIGGSEDSYAALAEVVARTHETGDDLTVAVVENPASEATLSEIETRVREEVTEAGLTLSEPDEERDGAGEDERASGAGNAESADVLLRRVSGEPGPRLVEIAERGEFDRLVLGGGTRSPMGKISLGEIAEYVLLNARVTVTLVR